MKRIPIVAAAIAGLLVLLAFVLATRYLSHERHMTDELRRELEQLRNENEQLRDQLATQRELLREQTLKTTRRSADELLGLFPAKFPEGNWEPAEIDFEDCWFSSSDGLRLHGWLLRHPQPRATLLHLHGNAGNLSFRAPIAEYLREQCSVNVMLMDYRGFGRSEGVPTMQGLLRDARAARTFLAQRLNLKEQEIVLMGESIGGAVAVDLAAEEGARGLVLENTFSSLREVASNVYPALLVSLLVADKLNSAAKIGKYHGPLFQVHGEADRLVPLASARKLFAAAQEPKSFLELPRHDHNDPLPEMYYSALAKFLSQLP